MDTSTGSSEIAISLSTLSEFYPENTSNTRRRLRSTIENENRRAYEEFVAASKSVTGALDDLQKDIDVTGEKCLRMSETTANTRLSTSSLLEESQKLQEALQTSISRSQLVSEFRERYQLSPDELEAIKGGKIDEQFFKALDHVVSIHNNCKALLRTHHQRAGLELLDSMASLQETAYECICRWVREEGRKKVEDFNPDISPILHQAARALRARPILLSYCAEEIASARQSSNFQRFIHALTRGPRPIEMHAPDPWRYASDMLAWVHTSLASEREFFTSLFGDEEIENRTRDPSELSKPHEELEKEENGTMKRPLIPHILNIVFQSIARPLKVRLEQVLLTSPPPLLCFRLSQLFSFHMKTFDDILERNNYLSEALLSCRAMAMRTFHDNIRHRGEKLIKYPPAPPPDLSLPLQLAEGADLALDLIESYERSVDLNDSGVINHDEFDELLSMVIGPLISAAEKSSEALNPRASGRVDAGDHLDPSDQRVYILNCLHELQLPLEGHESANKRIENLKFISLEHMKALAKAEVDKTLSLCNLSDINLEFDRIRRLREAEEQVDVVGNPLLRLPQISAAMRNFFGLLSDPAALPEFRKLRAPQVKAEAVNWSLEALADAYAKVYNELKDPQNGFNVSEVEAEIRHTPKQVRTLLGVS